MGGRRGGAILKVILMRESSDCEVAAIATACGVEYEEAEKALGWRKLPLGAENPIYGNSLNLHKALIKLGFWKSNITLSQLLEGKAAPNKTVVLLKGGVFKQHWVVYSGRSGDYYSFWWGDSNTNPKWFTGAQVTKMFTQDGPVNEAFEVYPASAFKLLIERIRNFFR
jgi:hypothetical protein